jgi:hypothetical protein
MRAALSSYVRKHDMLCCRVGGRPDDPCGDLASLPNALHSAGVVATAPGVRLHARGRRPYCYSGRDGVPPA